MSDEIVEKVVSIVASIKRIPPTTVSLYSTFEQLGVDSLDAIDSMKLEDAFNISIPDEQAKSIRGIAEMVNGIRSSRPIVSRTGSARSE